MPPRLLTAEEARALGLETEPAATPGRLLTPDEAAALGLPDVTPDPYAQGVRLSGGYDPGAITPNRAQILGLSQGGTLGFGEELGAGLATGAGLQPPPVTLGPQFAPSPDDTPEIRRIKEEALAQQLAAVRGDPLAYQQLRDRMRAELVQAQKQQPREYMAGELAGSLATGLLPGAQPGMGGTAAANAARLLASAGGAGGLAGLGASAEPPGSPEALREVGRGAALGTAGGLAGAALGKVAPAALRAAGRAAEKSAAKWGRRALLGGADQLSTRAKLPDEVALAAIREGGIVPFGTTEGAYGRLVRQSEAVGTTYGEIVDALERAGVQGPDARILARDLVLRSAEIRPRTTIEAIPELYVGTGEQLVEKARLGEQAGLGRRGKLGLSQAEDLKRSLQQQARYGRIEETPLNEARREVASILREANERAIMEAAGAPTATPEIVEAAQSFIPVKQRLGRLIEAEEAAERGVQRASTRAMGPGVVETTAAAASGSLIPLLTRIPLNIARSRGPSTWAAGVADPAARALFGASRLASATPVAERMATGAGLGSAMARALAMEPEETPREPDEKRRRRRLAEALRNVR